MRLSHHDSDRLLQILPALYALAPPALFFETGIHLLNELMPSDYTCFIRLGESAGHMRVTMAVESERRLTPRMTELLAVGFDSAPCVRYYHATHVTTPVVMSDFPECDRLEHRDRNLEFYRHMQLTNQIVVPVAFTPLEAVALNFIRTRPDFTERDRTVACLLQPHLLRAYANAFLVEEKTVASETKEQFDLTEREAQVAFWVGEGKTNAEIGLILRMATRTVEKHLEHVLAKLGVENRTTAALEMHRHHVGSVIDDRSVYGGAVSNR